VLVGVDQIAVADPHARHVDRPPEVDDVDERVRGDYAGAQHLKAVGQVRQVPHAAIGDQATLQVVGSTPPPANCTPTATPNGCPDQVVTNASTQAMITASAYLPTGAPGAALTRIPAPAAPGLQVNPSGFRAYVNFIEGDHGSLIDNVVPAVTAEMQGESISFAASNGQAILISVPGVIQP